MNKTTKKIVYCAVLAAMATVLAYLVRFPIFPSAAWLEYDMGDVPIFVGTVMFGPISGLMLTAVASIIQGLTVSASSGWIGILMHFLATGSCVLVLGAITNKQKYSRLIPAFVCGSITQVLATIPFNFIFTPALFVKTDVFGTVKSCFISISKALFKFPGGVKTVIVVFAVLVAFAVAFIIAVVYNRKVDEDNGGRIITKKGIVYGVILGLVYAGLVTLPMNLLVGNITFAGGMQLVYDILWKVLVPFNAIKAGGNAIIAYIIYIALAKRIRID